jgi:hypothetical protein
MRGKLCRMFPSTGTAERLQRTMGSERAIHDWLRTPSTQRQAHGLRGDHAFAFEFFRDRASHPSASQLPETLFLRQQVHGDIARHLSDGDVGVGGARRLVVGVTAFASPWTGIVDSKHSSRVWASVHETMDSTTASMVSRSP